MTNKTWTLPGGRLLERPLESSQPATIGDIGRIKEITGLSIQAIEVGYQLITIYIKLDRLKDITRAGTTLKALEAITGLPGRLARAAGSDITIELTRSEPAMLSMYECINSTAFESRRPGSHIIGASGGRILTAQVQDHPHLLIAGTTGSGKSIMIHSIIASLLYTSTPDHIRLIMIDAKRVKLSRYARLPHTYKVATDMKEVPDLLEALTDLMDRRYKHMQAAGVRSYRGTKIVVIIDELADTILQSPKRVEASIVRLAQLGRAAGIHLIVATQRPTREVVTGLIKSNLPSRITLKVPAVRDSMNTIDAKGGESLAGRGDGLYKSGSGTEILRVQGPYISPAEIERLIDHWEDQAKPPNLWQRLRAITGL